MAHIQIITQSCLQREAFATQDQVWLTFDFPQAMLRLQRSQPFRTPSTQQIRPVLTSQSVGVATTKTSSIMPNFMPSSSKFQRHCSALEASATVMAFCYPSFRVSNSIVTETTCSSHSVKHPSSTQKALEAAQAAARTHVQTQ